tara:strand:- start:16730 stop:17119 length:390 start_codon:yes stop_codon:yes gene_type:complete
MASVNLDTASRLNITCRRGDTFTLEVDFGEAVNTTGWTFRVKDRQQVMSDKVLSEKADASTIVLDDGDITIGEGSATGTAIANSKATITIPAETMNGIVAGTYSYDFQNALNGVVKTYIFGSFKVNSDV